jgi:hypothetical protein
MAARFLTVRAAWLPAIVAGLGLATPAGADEVLLRGGGRIDGVIVEQTARAIVLETGPGQVSVPASRVARVVRSRSSLETWRERSAGLQANDIQGWAALARWAEDAGLATQAREAWQRVLTFDPGNSEANLGLGRVSVDGRWLSEDEAYRARGYVSYGGRWISPSEHEAILRERAQDEAAELARQEAAARVREAEARAREAEARARQAEAADYQGSEDGGIPLVYAYGGSGFGMPHLTRFRSRPVDRGFQVPRPIVAPRLSTPPSSIHGKGASGTESSAQQRPAGARRP